VVPERNTRDAPQRTGTVIWDKTEEVKDPETKRVQKRDRPSSEWTVQKQEELRIVSEELWEAVRAQNTLVREKHGPKQLGGMFRTEASRRYLFSGLLRCGFCGANMVITTGVAPNSSYGCPYHRKRGVCQNKLTIKQATLEKQLVGRLVAILQAPEFIAEILEEFARQVSAAVKAEAAAAEQALGMHDELKQETASLCHTVENLTEAIAEHGLSPALSAKLRRCESRMAVIEQLLAARERSAAPGIDPAEVEEFLRRKVNALVEVLLGDPLLAKHELLKRINKLVLTPESRENGNVFVVSGDLKLFAADDNVMLTKSLHGIGEHYSGLSVSLDGFVVYPQRQRAEWTRHDSREDGHLGFSIPTEHEARSLDVESLFIAAISKHHLKESWEADSCWSGARHAYEYRDGFGGLRLAAALPEVSASVVSHF
jgi:site-specific DNA recombinase